MYKILVGPTFAAMAVNTASAQDYRKYWIECAKELGWQPYSVQKLDNGRTLEMWRWQNEAQTAAHSDCVARKASLASKPSGNVREGKGRR
jgi:hypothetical protein